MKKIVILSSIKIGSNRGRNEKKENRLFSPVKIVTLLQHEFTPLNFPKIFRNFFYFHQNQPRCVHFEIKKWQNQDHHNADNTYICCRN